MSKASFSRYIRLTRFFQPAHVRRLYRAIVAMRARRIVELGLGDGSRAQDMIALARRSAGDQPVRYTGIDLFEARAGDSSFPLKHAHSLLHSQDYKVRLVPGEVASALTRCANELRGTDLVVISAGIPPDALDAAWHLLPRMLHKNSQVWIERVGKRFDVLGPADLRQQTMGKNARRAA